MSAATVLVTGANGLVGSFVVRALLAVPCRVLALVRASSDRSLLPEAPNLEIVEGDLFDPNGLLRLATDVRTVVHTAGMVSYAPRDRDALFRVNVAGTAHVVNACLAAGIRQLIHISSVGALGAPDAQGRVTEVSRWPPPGTPAAYSLAKYEGELEVWRGYAEGLDVTVLNPSVVLGPGDWHKSSTRLFRYAATGARFFPAGHFNYVDARDVGAAVCQLVAQPQPGERFVLSAGTVTFEAFFGEVARHFGQAPPAHRVGPGLADVVWRVEKWRTALTGAEPLLTRDTARLTRRKVVFDGEKATQTLGLRYRSLAETLAWSCASLAQRTGPAIA